jgi:hypothetical protein
MDGIRNYYKWARLGTTVGFTNKRKQFSGSPCGIYVVWFIHQELCESTDLKTISDITMPDNEIMKYRRIFWNEVDVDDSEFQIK